MKHEGVKTVNKVNSFENLCSGGQKRNWVLSGKNAGQWKDFLLDLLGHIYKPVRRSN